MLDFFNVTKEALNLFPSAVDIVSELGIYFVPAINLGLEVLDSAINIAKGTLFGTVFALLFF